jgi:hypothetical protein
MTTFILQGTSRNRHAFNVDILRNGVVEKHKVHLEGGRPIVLEDIDVKLTDGGVVKRIKIEPDSLLNQLEKIKLASPTFLKWIEKDKKLKKNSDD